ncbi:hypothetical protein BDW74DRAFT_10468 [Aspergillus multicolor]|uniref:uncharacterized protein n=1 Tax=Aspergillus multicolor TaxID=41759 RepID=UPI003CCCD8FB
MQTNCKFYSLDQGHRYIGTPLCWIVVGVRHKVISPGSSHSVGLWGYEVRRGMIPRETDQHGYEPQSADLTLEYPLHALDSSAYEIIENSRVSKFETQFLGFGPACGSFQKEMALGQPDKVTLYMIIWGKSSVIVNLSQMDEIPNDIVPRFISHIKHFQYFE